MKAAIYTRLSEEDRDKKNEGDDSESIQNQKLLLLQYAIDNGFDVVDHIYNDDDFRGSDRNRPEWNRLLEDASQKKFDIILCKSQARFTRELEMVEKYLHGLFIHWGIRFIGVADHADTDNKGNKKSRQINGLVNEWYLEDLSDNIKRAFDAKRKAGLHIGSFSRYGYLKDPENKGHFIIDPVAAEVVREIFRLYADGMGKTAIAKHLNARGEPNPTEYKRRNNVRYKTPQHKIGTLWKYYAISDILIDEMYIGHMVQGKYGSVDYKSGINKPRPKELWYKVENTHDAIIDQELWDRVQELVRLRAKPFGDGMIGVFAKKARCKHCGYTMRTSKNRGVHYLKCGTRHVSEDVCIGSFVRVDKLAEAVLSELRNLLDECYDPEAVEGRVKTNNHYAARIAKLEADKSNHEKEIEACKAAVKTAYKDRVKGIISEQSYVEFSGEFVEDREKHEAIVRSIGDEIAVLVRKRDDSRSVRQIIEQYSDVEVLDRLMVEKLIDYVEVSKRDPVTRQVHVDVHWNF